MGRRTVLVLIVLIGSVAGVASSPPAAAAADGAPSRYLAVGPVRLADTRTGVGFTRLDPSTIRVAIGGRGGVPTASSAAVLTVTATQSRGGGYVSVFPAGTPRPNTSTLNLNVAGETVANTTMISLAGGSVDIFASVGVQLIVDVSGAFTPAGGPTAAGRFVGVAGGSLRAIDTRSSRPVAAGGTVRVARPTSIPTDALAIVANLTVVNSAGDGYWTAWPAGSPRPDASVLNTDRVGQTRAALTIVPVTSLGFDVFGSSGGHLLVDVIGYFTGASGAATSDGLFVATDPVRVLDTRGTSAVTPGSTVEVASPRRAAALVYNLTSTSAFGPGYVTALPAGNARPNTSNLNAPSSGITVANLAVTTLSTRGLALFSAGGEHLLVDVTGYFVGTPIGAPLPPPPNPQSGCSHIGVDRLNEVRSAAGVNTVQEDVKAFEFACQWSKQMHDSRSFAHSVSANRDRAVAGCGSGENIAFSSGPATDLFQLWIDSRPHFVNMTYPPYTHAGTAYYTGANGTYATMVLVIRC